MRSTKSFPNPQSYSTILLHLHRNDAIEYVATHSDLSNAPFSDKELANAQLALTNIERFGAPNWFYWRCKNWGTKWGACDLYACHSEDELVYEFNTAWSWPEPIFQCLCSRFIGLRILWDWHEESEVEYLDEDDPDCDRYVEIWHKALKRAGDNEYIEDEYFVKEGD